MFSVALVAPRLWWHDTSWRPWVEVQTPGQAFAAFLGALGFTRPVEQLELRSVPLPSLLFWLSRPKCSNLVEATVQAEEVKTTSACQSMAIAVSKEMLYKDRCPLVGVGLVYTPPYLPQVPFSVAYMNLCEWRDAQVASENWLVGTRLMFIHASEASEFLPVAEGHPVLWDVGKSLVALRSDLLAACSAFLADVSRVMDVPHADPRLALLEASLERFRRQASLKFDLPLAEMDAAAVDITTFMNARLQELSSLSKLPDLIGEAATLMDRHHNRVWELVQNPDLGLSDVYSRVLVGLLARQPIEADLFPGILEGLAGNLGLSPAGTVNPPRSRQEGVMRRWATALRQAAYDPSDTGQGSASSTTPLGLHLDYSMEFRSRRVGDIPPALTSSLLPSFPFLEKPRTGEPPSPPAAQQPEETDSPQSPLPDEEGEVDIQPHRQKMLVQFPFQQRKAAGLRGTPSKESTGRFGVSSDKEDDSVITVSDDGSDPNGASTSTGQTVPTSHRKRSREGGPSDAPPMKKPADGDETAPQQEQSPPAETTEAVLIATRNELYGKDYPPVQEVRARLLGLDPDVTPTDAQINASPWFALRSAAVERDAPDIVTDHWMPYLEENDRLADCPPEEFNATEGWVPLYTPEKLEEHLPAALSAFGLAKPPRLTAVIPPNFPLGMDKEFMLTSFHLRACLRRTSLTISGKQRQVAFCPYCGVTNDNAETGLNHVRKHLDVMLVCGGCHTKSVCLGQALQKHMKDNCPAVLAILGKTRGGRR